MDASRRYQSAIVSSNNNVSSWKIFSRWSMQLLNELPLFGTDDISIGSHVSCTIIDWLTHNNARNEFTLRFISFLNVICCTFCRLCYSYCRSLSFILSFIAVYIMVFVVHNAVLCCLLPFVLSFLSFLIACLSFFSVIFQ